MKKLYLPIFIALVLSLNFVSFGQATVFSDDFDSYVAGQQLACQNPLDWTTWSNLPCDATEDAYVSSNYAYSGANSVVVVQNNDLVHAFGPYTSGKWAVQWQTYVPTGATGYFNTLSIFAGASSEWGMQAFLNAGGSGTVDAGGQSSGLFNYPYDTWFPVVVVVDLDNDMAEFWLNGSMVIQWQWTLGALGQGGSLQLNANDFFGYTAADQMYIDDYEVIDMLTPQSTTIDFETVGNNWSWTLFSAGTNGSFDIVANPDPGGLNTSDSTAMLVVDADGDPWAGVFSADFPDLTIDSSNCIVKMLVYKDVISDVNLKLEPPNVDHNVPNTVTGAWEEITFDYSADIGTTSATLTIIPDFSPSPRTYGSTNYFDQITFNPIPPVPVELTSFTALANDLGQVVLNWQTASELNNQMFEIQRTTNNSEFATIAFIDGAGTTTEEQNYTFVDKTVRVGTYSYRLKQVDFDGRYEYSDAVEVEVNGPLTFNLEQNYPNPFNPTTNIKYSVPTASNVKLAVYNVVGEEVAVLVNGYTEAGFYETTFDASSLPSGVYIYKLQSGATIETNKMMLLK